MLSSAGLLWLLALLAAKHFVCDGPLQTLAMVRAKGTYGHWLGLAHAGIHGAGSAVALALCALPPGWVALIAALDAAAHYHIDFGKETLLRRTRWTTTDAPYWWTMIGDQTLHQLTYIAMAAVTIA